MRATSKTRRFKAKSSNFIFISKFRSHAGVHCPTFFILHQAAGCSYGCSYCYLRVLLRNRTKPRWYSNLDDLEREVRFWLESEKKPQSLNCGSVCDALAINTGYLERLIPLFAAQNRHYLNVLSKAGFHVNGALAPIGACEPTPSVGFSWTLNCDIAAERYERNAPTPAERCRLARIYSDCGWKVRYRIDPIFPLERWRTEYGRLLESLYDHWAVPEMLTFGTIRALPALGTLSDKEPYNPMTEYRSIMEYDKGFRHFRLMSSVRSDIYGFMVDTARSVFGSVPALALCKESEKMNRQVFDDLPGRCNCTK